jgi:hypothetical protein
MEEFIRNEIIGLQNSINFFMILIEEYDNGTPPELIGSKYAEEWYSEWSYAIMPWS